MVPSRLIDVIPYILHGNDNSFQNWYDTFGLLTDGMEEMYQHGIPEMELGIYGLVLKMASDNHFQIVSDKLHWDIVRDPVVTDVKYHDYTEEFLVWLCAQNPYGDLEKMSKIISPDYRLADDMVLHVLQALYEASHESNQPIDRSVNMKYQETGWLQWNLQGMKFDKKDTQFVLGFVVYDQAGDYPLELIVKNNVFPTRQLIDEINFHEPVLKEA